MATDDVLTPEATEFLHLLQREFRAEREALLAARQERAHRLRNGERPDFLEQTRPLRQGHWPVTPARAPGRTSTCRSSSRIARRDSGTRSSTEHRTSWESRGGRSARPC